MCSHTYTEHCVCNTHHRQASKSKKGGQNIKKGMRNKAGETDGVNPAT